MLPGERHREHVVKSDEEARYLPAAPEPLGSVAAILIDTGTRPDECYRLRGETVTWTNGRNGRFLDLPQHVALNPEEHQDGRGR